LQHTPHHPQQSHATTQQHPQQTPTTTNTRSVTKPGGLACMIGPVHPTHPVSRFFADAWMLFPKESEYLEWFTKAGALLLLLV
jgi:MPBQ/MSBQ methyltransferase